MSALRSMHAAREYGTQLFASLPYCAFVQTSDINPSFIVKWMQKAEGLRPDVEHVDPNDQRVTLVRSARMALEAAAAGKHVYVDYQTLGTEHARGGWRIAVQICTGGAAGNHHTHRTG